LLYYSYHIMVGLGTFFVAVMVVALFLLWTGRLFHARWMLWVLMLSAPFPYIANTAGWMTAELGRQPWLVYGLMRTKTAIPGWSRRERHVYSIGVYGYVHCAWLLGLFLIRREIERGPLAESESRSGLHPAAEAR